MEFTGERMIPEHNREDIIYSEHLLRYKFASQFVKGKRVLDVACGSGYGSRMLADAGAKSVVGADISDKAVAYASGRYGAENLEYVIADGTALTFNDNAFDVVVSFETIEHLEDYSAFLQQLDRVLVKSGVLIISSPNKDLYPAGNEFHFREFSGLEFQEMLNKYFVNIQILQQNNFLISSIFETENDLTHSKNDVVKDIENNGLYFVAVCSNSKLPIYEKQSLIASPSEIANVAVVEERERHIEILRKEIEELKKHIEYFKSHSVDLAEFEKTKDEFEQLKSSYKSENEKNEYLYQTLKRDEVRYDEMLALLKSKEDALSLLFETQKAAQDEFKIASETVSVQRQKLENLEAETQKLQGTIDELKLIEKRFFEEHEKTEYLYRLTKEKEAEVNSLLKELNEAQEKQFAVEAQKEEIESKVKGLKAQREELKDFEKKYIIEKEKAEYLYRLSIESDGKIKGLEGENQLLRQDKIQLSTAVETFSIELEEKKNLLSMQQSENQVLNERCSMLDELKDELKGAKAKLQCQDELLTGLRIDVFDSKSVIMKQNNELDVIRSINAKLENDVEELKNQIGEQEKIKIKQLTSIAEKDGYIHHIATELEQTKLLATKFEDAMNANLSRIRDLENYAHQKEKEISANETHISVLDSKIEMYATEVSVLRSSLSWRITRPLRSLFDVLSKRANRVRLLMKDIGYAFELLKREGIKSFFHRFYWYLKGQRLIEEIQYVKNRKFFKSSVQVVQNKAVITFDRVKKPLVSIVIPVYNQWDYTYNCLNSIYENTKGIDYEVIIADDVSDDETVNIKDYIKNIKVVRNKENLRFLLNCNTAAKRAKGDYVLFLNNDTCVHPNWLKELLSVFDRYENVGATGAKLVYEDGRLQEAGGIMWDDASGWNYGRLGDPQQPEYNYVKEVDYISGACLMIPSFLWKKLGGFDKHFVPAYYEDTDICFQIRNEGYKVILQPKAVVTHFEGVSNGTDLGSGQKKYQVANHKKFLEKWKTDLKTFHFKNAENVFLARERSRNKKQVLVIDHYVPHYDKDAGSRSTFSYLKLLVKMGCNVKFIGDNFYKHEPYTTELEQMGIEVLYGNHYFNHINDWLKENGKYFDYVFAHRMHIAPKYFEVLKKYSKAKIIYIGHDLQFIKSKKEYEFSNDEEHLRNHKKFKEIESAIFKTVDIIYPFSTYEAPLIQEIVPEKVVRPIPVYFFDDEYQQKNGFDQRKDILFVGGFGHPPNADAVLWFAKEIFPLVHNEIPEAVFHIVGSKPTKEIKALSSHNINVTGFVTDEELEEYYEKCKLSVIPLRLGAGVKGKLLETMYYKLPTVISPVAAEGVPNVEQNCHVAEKADDFAQKVISLYGSKDEWNKFSEKGANLIANYYSMNNAEELLKMDIKQ